MRTVRAVEFSGPVVLEQGGGPAAVFTIHLPGAGRDYFASGGGGGFLILNRYSSSSQFFESLDRLFIGGRVVAMTAWRTTDPEPVGLVVATADPDRLVFVRLNSTFPYFENVAEVGLAEDPAALADTGALVGGAMELAVALPGLDQVAIVGKANGVWGVQRTLAVGDGASSLVGIDLDGDSVLEIVVAQSGPLSRTLGILRRQSDDSFALETVTLPGLAPSVVASYDLDGNGVQELVVADLESPFVRFYNEVGGLLVAAGQADMSIVAESLVVADLPDGSPGLFAGIQNRGLVEFSALHNGVWESKGTYYPGCLPEDLALADIDGDGVNDLLAASGDENLLTALFGDGRPGFGGIPALGLERLPGTYVADDLDGDGWQDLLVADASETSLSLSLGTPGGALTPELVKLDLGFLPGPIMAADLDADPEREIVVLDVAGESVVVFDFDQASGLTQLSRTTVGRFPFLSVAGDLDGDGAMDLVVLTQAEPEVYLLYGDGAGGVAQLATTGFEIPAHWVAPVDLNGDGLLDLAATDAVNRVWTMANLGNRQFGNSAAISAGGGALRISVGDLDGDLDDDLVVANRSANSLSIFENDGSGILVSRIDNYALPGQPSGVDLADFDRDGQLDILLNFGNEGYLGLILGLDAWVYSPMAQIPGGPDMVGARAVDFNKDGVPDIFVLDRSLLLGMTLLNGDAGQVSVAPTALAGECRSGELELRVRPDRPGPWRLAVAEGAGWRDVMISGAARLGRLDYDNGVWLLHLSPTDLSPWLAAGGAMLRVRLTIGDGADRESDSRDFSLACLAGASGGRVPVTWRREPWPNPFNPRVQAGITLTRAGPVEIGIYDLAGRRLALLASGEYPAGEINMTWDGRAAGRPVAAGVYLLRVLTPGGQLERKLMLLK